MPSLFTSNGGIELPADGEQDGVWGDTVNANMQIIDRLTNGVGAITLSGTSHTLTTLNGTPSDGHYAVVVLGGSPTGTNTVTLVPNDAEKVYFVRNTTAESVIITQGSGGDVTIPAGAGAIVYANGAGTGAAVADLTAVFVPDLSKAGITASAVELNILDGVTADTAELNILDGVTADTAELNILDGVTATTAELNILAGVTATTAELNLLDGVTLVLADVTATAAELNILDGVTASTAELNLLDGVTATTEEINYLSGVTSAIQDQIDNVPQPPELTQLEVEDDTSTVFGQVSGQRLAQATASTLNASGSAPMYACRAWVNFSGTGVVAIRTSGNVSSVTDLATGNYRVNFIVTLPDGNCSAVTSLSGTSNTTRIVLVQNLLTTGVDIATQNGSYQSADPDIVTVAIFI